MPTALQARRRTAINSTGGPITLDAVVDGGLATATSLTFSHTVGSGSNRILFVGAFGSTSDTLTGATYNGTAMTLVGKIQSPTSSWVYLWYLVAPASGAHNVVISSSSSVTICGVSASYAGAKQTGQPDSSNTGTWTSAATGTLSTTTVAPGSWSILVIRPPGGTASGGTGTTARIFDSNGLFLGDSNNGIWPPGSHSMAVALSPNARGGGVIASFVPAP